VCRSRSRGGRQSAFRTCAAPQLFPDGGPPRQHPAVGVRGSIPRVGPRGTAVPRGVGLARRGPSPPARRRQCRRRDAPAADAPARDAAAAAVRTAVAAAERPPWPPSTPPPPCHRRLRRRRDDGADADADADDDADAVADADASSSPLLRPPPHCMLLSGACMRVYCCTLFKTTPRSSRAPMHWSLNNKGLYICEFVYSSFRHVHCCCALEKIVHWGSPRSL